MPVGEIFLSAFLQVLFDRLTSSELLQFARQEGIRSNLKKWEKMLMRIQAVLDDAEEKQLKDRDVKSWLDKLLDLAYDVEDILDEFATDALAKTVTLEQHQQASTSKVRNLLPACFNNWSPRALKFNIRMGSEIKNVTSRLEELCKLRDNLGLKEITGGTLSNAVLRRPPTTSVPTEPAVHGRDVDKAKILEMVLKNEPGDANFRVIPIVGMRGVGKTTLARQVYNDMTVDFFKVKAWVCISNDLDVLRISKAILESITGYSSDLTELISVQFELKQKVAGRTFLLVLDDYRSKDYGNWEILRSPFMAGAPGSRIIVTTRLREVALKMRPSVFYQLNILPDEDCWSVFAMHAFDDGIIAAHLNIELIRQKVIEKSKGLPLAAKTLGGLLRSKQKEDEWLEILSSEIWGLWEEDENEIPTALKLKEITGETSSNAVLRIPPTSSLQTEPAVHGREVDKAKILEMVLKDEPSDASFRVIPIVGMWGVGKTTLAQEVFNETAVVCFEVKAWVCISNDFDVLRISKAILESITGSSCYLMELEAVHIKLKQAVAGRKFLLVLDDVWSEDYGKWETLKAPFMAGSPGSRIIVTTRLREVALKMRPNEFYQLDLLPDEDCWSVFAMHAFDDGVIAAHFNIELIRQKVVEKSKGLPLAAKTLGCILRVRQTEDEWLEILNSKIWELLEIYENGISTSLKLSYHHLPSHLKRCFAYCAIFPKDYEFEKGELVLLWMAEGLLQQSTDRKQPEDIGGEYFYDLFSRSLFKQSSSNSSKFVMHDLVNDLAQMVSGKLHFRLEGEFESSNHSKISEKSRYSSYFFHEYNVKSILEVFKDFKHLRTHLSVQLVDGDFNCNYTNDSIVSQLLSKFKNLRVLSLEGYRIFELPNSIGGLRLLKYLNLSYSEIRSLPPSISSLYNLQTLLLRHCSNLSKLPYNGEYLINLRHLDILGASSIKEMPLGIRKWQCLRTLSNFIVGKNVGSRLRDLKHLNFLGGQLHISRLENVTDFEDTLELILSDKKDLEVLLLEWDSEFDDSRVEEVEKKGLDMLQPHRNLKELTITCYGGTKFSSWVGFQSFSKMTVLKLEDCKRCTTLPSLGLLGTLKNLTIKGLRRIKSIGSEIYGEGCSNPFRSLETLCIEDLEEWELWDPFSGIEGVESFPKLQELSIAQCPKLTERLPKSLPVLEKLVIRNCSELVVALSTFSVPSELEIDGCKKIVYNSPTGPKSLNSTTISNISDVGNWLKHDFQRVGVLIVQGSDELIKLWQNEIVFEKPPQGLIREHDMGNGKPLTTLLEGINQNIANLEELQICGCASLMFIFRGQLPPSIKILRIINCEKLQCLLDDKEGTFSSSSSSTSHLEELYIYKCPSLRWLSSRDQLSATLTRLHISHCSKLTTLLSRGRLPTTLKELKIHTCSDLTAILSRGELPEMLETLDIADCPKLKSIVERFHNNMSLRNIYVQDCPNLVSFPKTGFSKSNLVVWINPGHNLNSLANQMPLASLQLLVLCQCPKMSFPTEGLPTNLTSLEIEGPNLYDSLAKWGFHNLTSLRKLSINGCPDALSFPEDEMRMKLPHTLTHLRLENFSNQKYMSSMGIQNLSSLEELRISDCPNLASLPRLSSSILRLYILNCALLKEACKRDVGKEWPKIARIPRIMIDSEFINDPEEEASAN